MPTDKIMAYLYDARNGLYMPFLLVIITNLMLVIFRGSNLYKGPSEMKCSVIVATSQHNISYGMNFT